MARTPEDVIERLRNAFKMGVQLKRIHELSGVNHYKVRAVHAGITGYRLRENEAADIDKALDQIKEAL